MIEHVRFGPRNLDAASKSNLSLDTLSATDIAAYRAGAWLGEPVKSADLPIRYDDASAVAELAARVRVQLERHELPIARTAGGREHGPSVAPNRKERRTCAGTEATSQRSPSRRCSL